MVAAHCTCGGRSWTGGDVVSELKYRIVENPIAPTCRICQEPIVAGQKADESFLVRPDGITVRIASAHSRCVRPSFLVAKEPLG